MEAGWRFQAVLTYYLYLTSKELEKIVTRREFDCAPVRCSDQKLVACDLFNVFKYTLIQPQRVSALIRLAGCNLMKVNFRCYLLFKDIVHFHLNMRNIRYIIFPIFVLLSSGNFTSITFLFGRVVVIKRRDNNPPNKNN